ncbi:putative uncharacterized protein DDB_G0289263 [Microplitis demolitor]|uniref:putative uncharacterized protein DDB_G0289263 n=1 Tax=Microplitis demolitor TaxID=69319 RepID=UPI00235B5C1A|nr:putative uncharacterized protein DDB_G0289263 [Microplitis demolitor]
MHTSIFCLIIVATLTSQGCLGQNQQEFEVYGQPLLINLLENFRDKANFLRDETITNVSSISKDIVHQVYDKLRQVHGQMKGLSRKAIALVQTNADKIKESTESKLQEAKRAKEVEFGNLMDSLKDKSVRELNEVVQTSYDKLDNKTTNLMSLLDRKSNNINQKLRQAIKDTYRVESDNKWNAITSSFMEEIKSKVDQEVKLQVRSFYNQQFAVELPNYRQQLWDVAANNFRNFDDQLKKKFEAKIQEATAEIDHKLNEYSNKIQGLRINLDHLIADVTNINPRLQSKNNNDDHKQMIPDNSHINPDLINNSRENTNRDIGHGTSEQPDVNPDFVNNPYENSNRDIRHGTFRRPDVNPDFVNNSHENTNRDIGHGTSEQPDVNPDFVNNPYENSNRDIGLGTFRRPDVNPDFVNNSHENTNRDIGHGTSEQPDVNPDFVNNPYENSNRDIGLGTFRRPDVNPDFVNNSHENTNRDIGHGTSEQPDVNPDFVNNPYENSNRDIGLGTFRRPDVNPDFVNNPYENTNRDIGHGTSEQPDVNPDFVNNPYENSNRDIGYGIPEQPAVNLDFVNNLPHVNNDGGLKDNENDLSSEDLDKIFDEYRLPDVKV